MDIPIKYFPISMNLISKKVMPPSNVPAGKSFPCQKRKFPKPTKPRANNRPDFHLFRVDIADKYQLFMPVLHHIIRDVVPVIHAVETDQRHVFIRLNGTGPYCLRQGPRSRKRADCRRLPSCKRCQSRNFRTPRHGLLHEHAQHQNIQAS